MIPIHIDDKASPALSRLSHIFFQIRLGTDCKLGTGDFYFGPVVDGKFVQVLPDQAFKTGNFYRVPLLTDRDAYEVKLYSQLHQHRLTKAIGREIQ